MVKTYIPDRGDIVSLQFNPQTGREQAGWRPALVLSPKSYNQKVGLALFCPITKQTKGYPFEVQLSNSLKTRGVILSDHIKSLDWQGRSAKFVERLDEHSIQEVVQKIKAIIG